MDCHCATSKGFDFTTSNTFSPSLKLFAVFTCLGVKKTPTASQKHNLSSTPFLMQHSPRALWYQLHNLVEARSGARGVLFWEGRPRPWFLCPLSVGESEALHGMTTTRMQETGEQWSFHDTSLRQAERSRRKGGSARHRRNHVPHVMNWVTSIVQLSSTRGEQGEACLINDQLPWPTKPMPASS